MNCYEPKLVELDERNTASYGVAHHWRSLPAGLVALVQLSCVPVCHDGSQLPSIFNVCDVSRVRVSRLQPDMEGGFKPTYGVVHLGRTRIPSSEPGRWRIWVSYHRT